MHSKAIVPGPEFQVLPGALAPGGKTHHLLTRREIRKALINSDEHPEWQVYHAQPRFGLQRIPSTDHGQPGAAVLELAGVRARLGSQALPRPVRFAELLVRLTLRHQNGSSLSPRSDHISESEIAFG